MHTSPQQAFILASASSARAQLLKNAGLELIIKPSGVDEDELKASFKKDGITARNLADALAEAKALKISMRQPEALVLGADQVLSCGDVLFDKPVDMDHAAAHLRALSGKAHTLFSAVVIAENGQPIWRHIAKATMTMRPLSDDFIAAYLKASGDIVLESVGAYRLEGMGAQLFERIDGDFFTVLGLPLLPLLQYLRMRGYLQS